MNLKHNQRTLKGAITWFEMGEQTTKLKRSVTTAVWLFEVPDPVRTVTVDLRRPNEYNIGLYQLKVDIQS